MCGIAGVFDRSAATSADELRAAAGRIAAVVDHRGPDDRGDWVDPDAGIALAHRRLAVIDLSPLGHQPMASADGRYVATYNGELYDFRDLRADLEAAGHRFRGGSDTEVLVEAVAAWGLDVVLEHANGMFALALWDRGARALHLVRDRLGEKPLYYGWVGDTLLFASELDALRADPRLGNRVDPEALSAYLRLGFVPAPLSVLAGVRKLPAGSVLTVHAGLGQRPEPRAYWSLDDVAHRGAEDPFDGTDEDAVGLVEDLLRDAVRRRAVADVPVGAFLSGGVDSSLVVALLQDLGGPPARTFTVAFAESSHDESAAAAAVARHLGTDHTELRLPAGEALARVPELPAVYDEPFADPSALPMMLIAAEARRHVTVALSGDGGDEVFGGYNRYTYGPRVWAGASRVPRAARSAVRRALLAAPHAALDGAAGRLPKALAGRAPRLPADKVQKLAAVVGADDELAARVALLSHWEDPAGLLRSHPNEPWTRVTDGRAGAGLATMAERMMVTDAVTGLPDCMLVKVDRASMRVALEARLPLLDPRVVELALRLPLPLRIRGTEGKWVLRRVLDRYVPRELVDRPKTGFDPPIAAWLRGPLRAWASQLLADAARSGVFDPEPIHRRWDEHVSGRRNWDYALWTVLSFQSWAQDRGVEVA